MVDRLVFASIVSCVYYNKLNLNKIFHIDEQREVTT